MFGEYAQIASYLSPRDGYGNSPYVENRLPAYLRPPPHHSINSWEREKHRLKEDFIMIAEFSELEGPKPVMTIPKDGGKDFDQNTFSVRILATDHQQQTEGFTISEDAQVVLTDYETRVFAFVHHFVLFDNTARGFVRPYCIAYITADQRKLMDYYEEISGQMKKVARFFKYGNLLLFERDLERHLKDLDHTKGVLLNRVSKMRLRDMDQRGGTAQETRKNAETELYKALQSIHQSTTEIKEILLILRPLRNDKRLEDRFRLLEERAFQAGSSSNLDNLSLQENWFNDTQSSLSLDVTFGSLNESKGPSHLSLFRQRDYKPVLVETKKANRFNSSLRGLHELCSWGAKDGLRKLRQFQEYFKRDMVVLDLEKTESRLFAPSNTGVFCGQCVAGNFLHDVRRFLCDDDEINCLSFLDRTSLASLDSLASFKSAEEVSWTLHRNGNPSPSSFQTVDSQNCSYEMSLADESEYYPQSPELSNELLDFQRLSVQSQDDITPCNEPSPGLYPSEESKELTPTSLEGRESAPESCTQHSAQSSLDNDDEPTPLVIFQERIERPLSVISLGYQDSTEDLEAEGTGDEDLKNRQEALASQGNEHNNEDLNIKVDSLKRKERDDIDGIVKSKDDSLKSKDDGNKDEDFSSKEKSFESKNGEDKKDRDEDKGENLSSKKKSFESKNGENKKDMDEDKDEDLEKTLEADKVEVDGKGESLIPKGDECNRDTLEGAESTQMPLTRKGDNSQSQEETDENAEKAKLQDASNDLASSMHEKFLTCKQNESTSLPEIPTADQSSIQTIFVSSLSQNTPHTSKNSADNVCPKCSNSQCLVRKQQACPGVKDLPSNSSLDTADSKRKKFSWAHASKKTVHHARLKPLVSFASFSSQDSSHSSDLSGLVEEDGNIATSTPSSLKPPFSFMFKSTDSCSSRECQRYSPSRFVKMDEGSSFEDAESLAWNIGPHGGMVSLPKSSTDSSSDYMVISAKDLMLGESQHGIPCELQSQHSLFEEISFPAETDNFNGKGTMAAGVWHPHHGLYTLGDWLNNLAYKRPGYGLAEVLNSYHNMKHIIFSLLTGRPVLIIGTPSMEHEVVKVVSALAVFVPSTKRNLHNVIEWTSKPLKACDLTKLRLIGVCNSKKRTLDSCIPFAFKRSCSVLDVDKRLISAPAYQGQLIQSLLTKRKVFKGETLFLSHIHWWLMDLMAKAFIFFHSFCIGLAGCDFDYGNLQEHRDEYRKAVASFMGGLAVRDNDCSIIEHLAEVAKLSHIASCQPAETDAGKMVVPFHLRFTACQTYRC